MKPVKHVMTFYKGSDIIAQCNYYYRSEEHTSQLEKSRKRLVSEYHKIPQKSILVYDDEVEALKHIPLKHAA